MSATLWSEPATPVARPPRPSGPRSRRRRSWSRPPLRGRHVPVRGPGRGSCRRGHRARRRHRGRRVRRGRRVDEPPSRSPPSRTRRRRGDRVPSVAETVLEQPIEEELAEELAPLLARTASDPAPMMSFDSTTSCRRSPCSRRCRVPVAAGVRRCRRRRHGAPLPRRAARRRDPGAVGPRCRAGRCGGGDPRRPGRRGRLGVPHRAGAAPAGHRDPAARGAAHGEPGAARALRAPVRAGGPGRSTSRSSRPPPPRVTSPTSWWSSASPARCSARPSPTTSPRRAPTRR